MDRKEKREMIAKRIAKEFKDGYLVNLGIGMPTLIPKYIPKDVNVLIHSENGIVGMGPAPEKGQEDPDLSNAGGQLVTAMPGACYVDSALSFQIIRGGHLDATVLGALQVDQAGSIANWMIPGKVIPGMGGAMDLLSGAKTVIASMEHVDKNGKSKIVKECDLPLSAYKVLSLIVTDMAYIRVTEKGLVLEEVASWTNVDEVVACTDADLILPDKIGIFSLED